MYIAKTVEEAQKLLDEIRSEIKKHQIVFMNGPRKDGTNKNAETLTKLGITSKIQREIIDSLTAEDYCSGPDSDEKYPWKVVAVFGSEYAGAKLYIKFSIGFNETPVVCISFHEAEYAMKFKFK